MAAMATAPHTAPMTPADQEVYDKLVNDTTLWDMPRISRELGVEYQTVKVWRKRQKAAVAEATARGLGPETVPQAHNRLPVPKPIPALEGTPLADKPLWPAGVIRLWAMRTGRMDPTGKPQRRRSTGRPPGSTNRPRTAAA